MGPQRSMQQRQDLSCNNTNPPKIYCYFTNWVPGGQNNLRPKFNITTTTIIIKSHVFWDENGEIQGHLKFKLEICFSSTKYQRKIKGPQRKL